LTQQSDDVVRDEIMPAKRAIVQASGQTPRPACAHRTERGTLGC
jgi:hypothetical protein